MSLSPKNRALVERVLGVDQDEATWWPPLDMINALLDAARREGENTIRGTTVAEAMLAETGLPAFIAGHARQITLRWSDDATKIMWTIEPEMVEVLVVGGSMEPEG